LNNEGKLFWRNNILSDEAVGDTVDDGQIEAHAVGDSWVEKPYDASYGKFTGIGYCTSGHVWAMNNQGQLYFKDGITQEDLIGAGTWTQDMSASADNNMAAQITCGMRGQFAMVTTDGKMMVKNLVNYADPMGMERGWHTDATMNFKQVTIGEQGQLYALVDKEIYIRNGRTDLDAAGSDW
jgi:hypothetical protein